MDTNIRRARARARARARTRTRARTRPRPHTRARRPAHGSSLRFSFASSRLRVRKTGISVPDRQFRINAARAFQPEICPAETSRGVF